MPYKKMKFGMKEKGFTLTELLIVISVAAVLVAIAVPNFMKTVEKEKANQAINYLRLLRSAQKIYYSNNSAYACTAAADCANATGINNMLGTEITEDGYSFTVVTSSTAGTDFTATATNNSDNATIILDQDGTWTGTSSYKPTT